MRLTKQSRLERDPVWTRWKGLALPRNLAETLENEAAIRQMIEQMEREGEVLVDKKNAELASAASNAIVWGTDSPARTGPRMPVFGRADVEKFDAANPPGDSEQQERKAALIKLLRRRGGPI